MPKPSSTGSTSSAVLSSRWASHHQIFLEGRQVSSVIAKQNEIASEKQPTPEQVVQRLRELMADAPELGKKALENVLQTLIEQAENPPPPVESAGRIGAPLGKVSELTIIITLIPGSA